MQMRPKIFLFLISVSVVLSGCAASTNLVLGDSSKYPKNAQEYYDFLEQSDRLKDHKVIAVDYATVEKRLKKAEKECYQFNVATSGSRTNYEDRWTGKVARLNKGQLFFTMQTEGVRNSETKFADGKGQAPKDGLYVYGVEFTRVDNTHTRARFFAPFGWGSYVKTIVSVAEGGYGDQCPKNSERFPGANN